MPEEQHGRSVLRVPWGVVPPSTVAANLSTTGEPRPVDVAAGIVTGRIPIPVQFGGLPVGVGQTLLMFTMKRGIVATFDPEYSDKRMPDCTLMVTLDVTVLATFSLLKLVY